jgi:hypothetical protein
MIASGSTTCSRVPRMIRFGPAGSSSGNEDDAGAIPTYGMVSPVSASQRRAVQAPNDHPARPSGSPRSRAKSTAADTSASSASP